MFQVLESSSYQQSVERLSSLILDQPQHPLERATWWLEYLLRHPHNQEMRPHTHNLNWVQYFLIDVMAVFLLALTALILLIIKLLKCCCSRQRSKHKTE